MNVFNGGLFMTPEEIYRAITEGPGARTLGFAVDATRAEGERESERSSRILDLADKIQGGWQGDASAGAFGAALPLAMTAEVGSAQLLHSQDLLDRQNGSFHKVRNEVRPVTSAPENPPLDDAFPFDTDHDREVTSYQSDAQHNMAVFGVYDDASSYNETNMPQEYRTSTRGTGDVTVQAPADTIEVGDPSPGNGDPRRTAGPGDSSGPTDTGFPGSGGPAGGPPPGSTGNGPGQGVGPGSGPGQTSPNDFRPEPPPAFGPAFPPGSQQQSPAAANQGTFTGTLPYNSGGYPGGGGGYGPRGGGGGMGAPGGGGSASPRPVVPGPGPGAAAGALAAEEAAARRAAQAAATAGARGGMAPMGGAPMAGGRGKDDEDAEHERKVLIESDPEETFGSDVLTAPQVIGDDEYED